MSTVAKLSGLRAVASLLYPPVCTICTAMVGSDDYLCEECKAKTTRIIPPFCGKCSEPFEGTITGTFICANCAHRTIHFNAAVAAYRSRGIIRQIIHDFKYGRQIHLRHLVTRLLAELLSAQISIQSKPLLERIRYTTTQTALDRSERMENLHNAFRLRKNANVRGLRVLLIDDVLTTGSTLSECARVLKRAGALSVLAATAARA